MDKRQKKHLINRASRARKRINLKIRKRMSELNSKDYLDKIDKEQEGMTMQEIMDTAYSKSMEEIHQEHGE